MKAEVMMKVVAAASMLATTACGAGFSGGAGDKPEGTRLVEGRLAIPDEDLLGRQVTGLQIAALHLDANGGIAAFPSAVFDPSGQRAEAAFVATVNGGVDTVLVLQVPSATQRSAGSFLGLLTFDGDSLVPRGEDDIDLGTLTVSRGARVPADTTLSSSAAASPSAQTDTDGDGLTNDVDDDDDDDGTPDGSDDDVAGDGIADQLQRLSALVDEDGDGVPDALR